MTAQTTSKGSTIKVGILGTGNIGKTLVVRLSQAGHDVKVANSRGPETIDKELLASGARAVTTEDALKEDYYPFRDDKIDAIEQGQVESVWVTGQLGRPIAKAWNAIGSASLANKAKPEGASDRIAIPVAADRDHDRKIAMSLVDDTGLDAFDAGSLVDSWRQQPGARVLHRSVLSEISAALDAAQRERLPKRRDLGVAVMQERFGDGTTNPDEDWGVRLVRAINM